MPGSGAVAWLVVDQDRRPIDPIRTFLLDFTARGNRPESVRSYAYDLLRWWRWLRAVGVEWDRVTPAEVRDLVLWLRQASKPRSSARTASSVTAGTINPLTQKQYLGDGYAARTVRHSNAVLRSFYAFWLEAGKGPLINPVQLDRRDRRPHAHHNPLETFRPEGRLRYNPKLPKRRPREIPDERWRDLFSGLTSNRDRAILATGISNGVRAGELLGMRNVDLDWGEGLIRVFRKGTGAEQWLPGSQEAFVWIRLYLDDLGESAGLDEPLWWTLRRRDHGSGHRRQPLSYEALRAVFRRANDLLDTNWSMHDLRHTAALRMSRDDVLSMKDIQIILGHQHLSTTADVYLVEDESQVVQRVHRYLADRGQRASMPAPPVAAGYDADDLNVLFGGLG